jgi:hypothetical protein
LTESWIAKSFFEPTRQSALRLAAIRSNPSYTNAHGTRSAPLCMFKHFAAHYFAKIIPLPPFLFEHFYNTRI